MDPKRDLTELEDDIRATSEDVVADAKRLLEVEEQKVDMDADAPERIALALEAEDLGDRIAQKAELELVLAEKAKQAK